MRQQLCKIEEIASGQMKEFVVNNRKILLVRKDNEFFAMHGTCPHQGAELVNGYLTGTNLPSERGEFCFGKEGQVVRCPWHNHEYDVATGCSIHDPARNKVKGYSVEIQGEDVMIEI